jgi:predicted XRE-type DNA-binding protein
MKIDTEIRHVTKAGANIFLELGFPPAEAKRLKAAAVKERKKVKLLKQQLMRELASWVETNRLKQDQVAEILMVSRPRVSDALNEKTTKFTVDALIEMLGRIGKTVKVAVI